MKKSQRLNTMEKSIVKNLKPVIHRICLVIVLGYTYMALFSLSAQVPQGFNYQAMALDDAGEPILNTVIPVRLTIQSDSLSGTVFWEELHSSVSTNDLGIFTLIVGRGTRQSGTAATFDEIDWTVTPKFIMTEVDYGGWKLMGSSRLWAVPYSLVAKDLSGSVNKLTVEGQTTSMEESLFDVKNKNGQTVFAVYNEGVRIYVDDGDAKGLKGGFAIGGLNPAKGTGDLFIVNADSIRAYIDTNPAKGIKGGFAIGGLNPAKAVDEEYLRITRDSARINVANPAKGTKGGFAVRTNSFVIEEFDDTKGTLYDLMNLTPDNYFIGHESGMANTTGLFNSFLGYRAGMNNTTGESNLFFGYNSGVMNTEGYSNVFIGDSAGSNNDTGWHNIFIGANSGRNNTTGPKNIAIGSDAGVSLISGWNNTFIGELTGAATTTGNSNVMIGNYAGINNIDGSFNVLIGKFSGYSNTSGQFNINIGFATGRNNINGSDNVFMGRSAGLSNDGSRNVFIGTGSGELNFDGNDNVLIGFNAGRELSGSNKLVISNWDADTSMALIYGEFDNRLLQINGELRVFGDLKIRSGTNNLFLGDSAGFSNSGPANTFIGSYAGVKNTSGMRNLFAGAYAGYSNTEGNSNTYIGRSAGETQSTGFGNTYLGDRTAYNKVSGDYNLFLGRLAGLNNLDGSRNVFVGYLAGCNETGSERLYIENTDVDNTQALIYGEFDNDYLKLNALTSIRDALILEPRPDPPATPAEGMMYFDSDDKKLKVYDGTQWISLW